MSSGQFLLAIVSAVFLYIFATGTAVFAQLAEHGLSVSDLPYIMAIPGMALFALYMLRV